MFDYSYERVIFGSQQPRGPVYLNTYSITQFYESLVKSFNLPVCIFKIQTSYIPLFGHL